MQRLADTNAMCVIVTFLTCAELGGNNEVQSKAPCSAEEGARSIAWNVEHKQPEEISGRVWRHGKDIGF